MVLTHLVLFEYLPGASTSAAPDSFGGSNVLPPYYLFDGFSESTVVPPVVIPDVPSSGVRKGGGKRRIVRRADFSSQENYAFALRAALLDANFGIRPDDEPQKPEPAPARKARPIVVTDTAIKVSAADMAALQLATEMEELEMLDMFLTVIEREWE